MLRFYLYKIILKERFFNMNRRIISTSSFTSFSEDFNHILKSLGSKFNLTEIKTILSSCEEHVCVSSLVPDCPVKEIYINQLPANIKVEDRWNVGVNQVEGDISSMLAGVVDGHSGKDCAQLVNKAGLEYIAASCLNVDKLQKTLKEYKDTAHYTIVRRFHPAHWESLNDSVQSMFMQSLFRFMQEMIEDKNRLVVDPGLAMKTALIRLDRDMCMPVDRRHLQKWFQSRPLLRLSLSGAVALFMRLYWRGQEGQPKPTIHIANVGDCAAVLARLDNDRKALIAKPLNELHTLANPKEMDRLTRDHADDDPQQLCRDGRLLGELIPSRSFGDVRYKWSLDWLQELDAHIKLPGDISQHPTPYTNPPYLSAEPDVHRYVIETELDKFIILATDGLWDCLSPQQAVDIVANCPLDQSPATQLVTFALSGHSLSEDVNVQKLSMHLAMKPGVARYFRDDITVMVFKL